MRFGGFEDYVETGPPLPSSANEFIVVESSSDLNEWFPRGAFERDSIDVGLCFLDLSVAGVVSKFASGVALEPPLPSGCAF